MENKDIVKLLEDAVLEIKSLQVVNKGLMSQNETWQRVSESNSTVDMSTVAKVLNYKDIGRNKLFKILRGEGILRHNNEPYQKHIDADHFDVIEQEVNNGYGNIIVSKKTVVTQKGIDYIRKRLDKLGYEYGN